MPPEPMIPLASPRDLSRRKAGMISVCLPSRHRPEMLAASIRSLREHAARPELLEFLVAHDPDDQQTSVTAWAMLADVIWQAPERFGYGRSAQYYAALIEQAHGEWFLPTWGDDGLMRSPGWDEIVRAQPPGSVLWTDGNIEGLTCFPIVHADVLAALGRLCPLPALDSWFEYVARDAGILTHPHPPIFVLQDRFDLTGRNNDATYREGRGGHRAQEFFGAHYLAERAADTRALMMFRKLVTEYERRLDGPWSDIQDQLPDLYRIGCQYPGLRVLEFGVRTGESTSAWLAAAARMGGQVRSFDLEQPQVPAWWRECGRWSFTQADSLAPGLPAPACDVLFLDTSHTYMDTLRELERWVPAVVPGGRVLCHDTRLETAPFDPKAVARALDDFCPPRGLTWNELGGQFGLGEIIINGKASNGQ